MRTMIMCLAFSILSRIESSVTSDSCPCQRISVKSFSILSRIESSVTRSTKEYSLCYPIFQYPLSDRIVCDI